MIIDIVTGREVQANERTYGGVAMTPEATLTDLVKAVCFDARRHVQSAGWGGPQPCLVVTVDSRRWIGEIERHEAAIFDRIELAGHQRPEHLIVISRSPLAVSASAA
jgi:hypothetical protein